MPPPEASEKPLTLDEVGSSTTWLLPRLLPHAEESISVNDVEPALGMRSTLRWRC